MRHGESSWAGNETTSLAEVAVLCTLNWERDFPCMWHQTHTRTCTCMVEAVSVAREATNGPGESSSDSVSTQECAKLHLRASIFPKIFWGGGMPPDPPTERRLRAKPLCGRLASPTKRTTLKDFLDPTLIYANKSSHLQQFNSWNLWMGLTYHQPLQNV